MFLWEELDASTKGPFKPGAKLGSDNDSFGPRRPLRRHGDTASGPGLGLDAFHDGFHKGSPKR